ncbi:hypothetical protein [Micromonospora sp. NPDC047074]|uniref:hypothetical protein n=1 Tax=Micromonospora sp. NPDC047074 TaxID=3154339 RepID=UPI0033E5352A
MLNALVQAVATKLVEFLLQQVVGRIAPPLLRSVPHAAPPNCPRCGGYGVARWAPAGMQVVFLLSLCTFALGFTFAFLGLPAAVLVAAHRVAEDGLAGLPAGLVALTGPLVPAAVALVGAFGLAWFHSYPPKRCHRCGGRWPRRDRADYLRAAAPERLLGCGCGKRLRLRGATAGTQVRCPNCGREQVVPAATGRT